MHNYIVAITVTSKRLTIEQISEIVGHAPTFARKKGELNFRGEKWRQSTWRLEPLRPKSSNLEKLTVSVLSEWPIGVSKKLCRVDPRCAVELDVAVIHHTYTATFTLTPSIIRAAAERELPIVVSSYPGQKPAHTGRLPARGTRVRSKSRR
jgi:hypothetical protein